MSRNEFLSLLRKNKTSLPSIRSINTAVSNPYENNFQNSKIENFTGIIKSTKSTAGFGSNIKFDIKFLYRKFIIESLYWYEIFCLTIEASTKNMQPLKATN
jgi:hypothetical protein